MNKWVILDSLKQITDLDEEGASAALPLCSSGLDEVLVRLKDTADEDDPRVIAAAAAIAYYKLALKRADENESCTRFKAGDVTISQSASAMLENAANVRSTALLDLLPLLKDDEFVFMGVGN